MGLFSEAHLETKKQMRGSAVPAGHRPLVSWKITHTL